MFEIKYRIIVDESYWRKMTLEQIEKEGAIEGFFQINFDSVDYGYYHDKKLQDGEEGFDLISTWLANLLEVCLLINNMKYVALKDIESYNTWLEFIPTDNNLLVSVIQLEGFIVEAIITNPLENRVYPEWKHISVKKIDFIKEIIHKTEYFITDVSHINPFFSKSQRIVRLKSLINKIRQEVLKKSEDIDL